MSASSSPSTATPPGPLRDTNTHGMFNLERLERRVAEACGTDRIRYHFGMFAVRNARAVPRNASPTPDAALGWPMQTTSACKRSGATISDGLASGGVRLALLKPNAR